MATTQELLKKKTSSTSSALAGFSPSTITKSNSSLTPARSTSANSYLTSSYGVSRPGVAASYFAKSYGDIPSGGSSRTPSYGGYFSTPSKSGTYGKASSIGGLTPATAKPNYSQQLSNPPKSSTPKPSTGVPAASGGAPTGTVPTAGGAQDPPPVDTSQISNLLALMIPTGAQSQAVYVGGDSGQPLPSHADRGFGGRDPAIANRGLGNYLDQIRQGFWGG